jgi:hypothetical protein
VSQTRDEALKRALNTLGQLLDLAGIQFMLQFIGKNIKFDGKINIFYQTAIRNDDLGGRKI